MELVISFLLAVFGTSAAWVLVIFLNPEAVSKWAGIFWGIFSFLGDFARKKHIKNSIEGRVGQFSREVKKVAPALELSKPRIEWVEGGVEREAFLQGGEAIIRLRRDDPEHFNFVHAVFLFTSTCLLAKTKRYLSKSQKQSLDLFVAGKILNKQGYDIYSYFIDQYLHPKLKDKASNTTKLFEKYGQIDRGGIFFPIFLQELEFLGSKIFGSRKDEVIISEVNELADFLEKVSTRNIGDEMDLDFKKSYCKFFIVIVGKPSKLAKSIQPYVSYIRNEMQVDSSDTIYLVALLSNRKQVDQLGSELADIVSIVSANEAEGTLYYPDGEKVQKQYILILRSVDSDFMQVPAHT